MLASSSPAEIEFCPACNEECDVGDPLDVTRHMSGQCKVMNKEGQSYSKSQLRARAELAPRGPKGRGVDPPGLSGWPLPRLPPVPASSATLPQVISRSSTRSEWHDGSNVVGWDTGGEHALGFGLDDTIVPEPSPARMTSIPELIPVDSVTNSRFSPLLSAAVEEGASVASFRAQRTFGVDPSDAVIADQPTTTRSPTRDTSVDLMVQQLHQLIEHSASAEQSSALHQCLASLHRLSVQSASTTVVQPQFPRIAVPITTTGVPVAPPTHVLGPGGLNLDLQSALRTRAAQSRSATRMARDTAEYGAHVASPNPSSPSSVSVDQSHAARSFLESALSRWDDPYAVASAPQWSEFLQMFPHFAHDSGLGSCMQYRTDGSGPGRLISLPSDTSVSVAVSYASRILLASQRRAQQAQQGLMARAKQRAEAQFPGSFDKDGDLEGEGYGTGFSSLGDVKRAVDRGDRPSLSRISAEVSASGEPTSAAAVALQFNSIRLPSAQGQATGGILLPVATPPSLSARFAHKPVGEVWGTSTEPTRVLVPEPSASPFVYYTDEFGTNKGKLRLGSSAFPVFINFNPLVSPNNAYLVTAYLCGAYECIRPFNDPSFRKDWIATMPFSDYPSKREIIAAVESGNFKDLLHDLPRKSPLDYPTIDNLISALSNRIIIFTTMYGDSPLLQDLIEIHRAELIRRHYELILRALMGQAGAGSGSGRNWEKEAAKATLDWFNDACVHWYERTRDGFQVHSVHAREALRRAGTVLTDRSPLPTSFTPPSLLSELEARRVSTITVQILPSGPPSRSSNSHGRSNSSYTTASGAGTSDVGDSSGGTDVIVGFPKKVTLGRPLPSSCYLSHSVKDFTQVSVRCPRLFEIGVEEGNTFVGKLCGYFLHFGKCTKSGCKSLHVSKDGVRCKPDGTA